MPLTRTSENDLIQVSFARAWQDRSFGPISCCAATLVIDLFASVPYVGINRTRPASVRKDMHTGRVFYFGLR